jgi:ATP-dependent Zn protease
LNHPTLVDVLISWFPMILFVGVMIALMRKMRSPQDRLATVQEAQLEALRKQNELLERIARALEGKSPPMFGAR